MLQIIPIRIRQFTHTVTEHKKLHFLLTTFLVLTLYITLDQLYFHSFSHNLLKSVFMNGGDPYLVMWSLHWWPFAITHHLNPFITYYVWAPVGFNLTWATSVPTLSLLTAPITMTLGTVASWNILNVLAPVLSAYCAFLLLKYLFKDSTPAVFGGFFFGFGSYELGQLLGHLNLTFVCIVPLLLLVFIMRQRIAISRRRFIFLSGLLIALQAGVSTEVLVTTSLFGAIAILVFFVFVQRERPLLWRTTKELAVGYVFAVILISPFAFYLLKGISQVPKTINDPTSYSADLLNYVIPTPITWLGGRITANISSHFAGNFAEEGAYFGFPTLLFVFFSLRSNIAKCYSTGLALSFLFVAFVCLSLGPSLQVDGFNTKIAMPAALLLHLPFLRSALPTRFTLFVSLLVSILIVSWLSIRTHSILRYALAVLCVVTLIPNPSNYSWSVPFTPKLFLQRSIITNTNSLILPYASSMFWQVQDRMRYRDAAGYLGYPPVSLGKQLFVTDLLWGGTGSDMKYNLMSYASEMKIRYVVKCPGTPSDISVALQSENWSHISIGGCIVYSVPRKLNFYSISGDVWGSYASLGWIGKSVDISTHNKAITVTLTGKYLPTSVGNIHLIVILDHKKKFNISFSPQSSQSQIFNLKGDQSLRIFAYRTWTPAIVLHTSDTRYFSVSMAVD